MRRSLRWTGRVSACLAASAAAIWLMALLHSHAALDERSQLATVWAYYAVIVGMLASVLRFLLRPLFDQVPDKTLSSLVELLESQSFNQWSEEATRRKLINPSPIAIKWSAIRLGFGGSAESPHTSPSLIPRIPGVDRVRTTDLLRGGYATQLHRVYAGLDSGRLVISGTHGSGKTGSAIRLVLEAISYRRSFEDDKQRALIPVPLMLSTFDYSSEVGLWDWMATRTRDLLAMPATAAGTQDALRLLKSGRVAIVFDGLDAVALADRAIFISEVNKLQHRVVLLANRESLRLLPTELVDATIVELQPVTVDAVTTYINEVLTKQARVYWRPADAVLRGNTATALREVMSSPFYVSLVPLTCRTADDVAQLISTATSEASREFLLRRLVEEAYEIRPETLGRRRQRRSARVVWSTLKLLADRMTTNLTPVGLKWWELADSVPRLSIAVLGAMALGPPVGLALFAAWYVIWTEHEVLNVQDPRPALLVGFVIGATMGVASVLLRNEPGRISLHWRGLLSVRRWAFAIGSGLLASFGEASLTALITLVATFDPGLVAVTVLITVPFATLSVAAFVLLLTDASPYARRNRAVAPQDVYTTDLAATMALMGSAAFFSALFPSIITSVAAGLLYPDGTWFMLKRSLQLSVATVAIPCTVWALMGSASWKFFVLSLYLRLRIGAPLRLMHFLQDARDRGVLRTAGSTYEFRHLELQAFLSRETPKT